MKINYINIPRFIYDHMGLLSISLEEAMVLIAINFYKEKKKTPMPENIAEHLKVSDVKVNKIFNSLIKKNLIEIKKRELSLDPLIKAIDSINDNEYGSIIKDKIKNQFNSKLSVVENNWIDSIANKNSLKVVDSIITSKDCPNDFEKFVKMVEAVSKPEKRKKFNWTSS